MPLYVADYLVDTAHLDAAESGAYLHLIMSYWVNGSLPQEDKKLALIARMTTKQWNKAKATIKLFFGPDWKHDRIEVELAKVIEISNKRKDAAEQMHAERRANAPAQADTLHTSPTPNKKEVSKKDTREVALSDDWPSGHEDIFWVYWPNKVGKPAAMKALASARKRCASFSAIIAGVHAYIRDKPPDRPWLNPATFLNQNRWEDQPAQVQNGKTSNIIQATDNLVSILASFDGRASETDAICGPESAADVRLLSQRRG